MKKNKIFGVCTLCGREFYENKKHYCKVKDLKDTVIHYKDLCENYFNESMKAQRFIKDNIWNVDDKEKIKELLLIIWNSMENNKFKIKTEMQELEGNNE